MQSQTNQKQWSIHSGKYDTLGRTGEIGQRQAVAPVVPDKINVNKSKQKDDEHLRIKSTK